MKSPSSSPGPAGPAVLTVLPGLAPEGPTLARRDAPTDWRPPLSAPPPRADDTPARDSPLGGGGLGLGLEASLVVAARGGDTQAFECLVRSHRDDLVRLRTWLLADGREAQEAVQATLVLAWRRLPTLRDPQMFRAWLYQIMTRRCLQTLRRPLPQRATPPRTSSSGSGPSIIDTALSRALAELPPDQRECWALRELHHRSYAEIARSTGASVTAVRGRLARARRRLPAATADWR